MRAHYGCGHFFALLPAVKLLISAPATGILRALAANALIKTKKSPHARESHPSKRDWTWSSASIPPSPPVGVRLYSFLRSHDYTCEGVVDIVRLDPDLTAQLLRLCNSIVYRRAKGIASLHEAVLRIGAAALSEKVMSLMLGRLFLARKTAYCPDPNAQWRHSVQCALAAGYLGRHCSRLDSSSDLNFTAALLHDIGKSAINTAPRNEISRIVHLRDVEGHSAADAELEVLGVDHAEVGGQILEHWQLPREIVAAVRYHHTPEFDESPLASLVHIANVCAFVGDTSKDWDDFENRLEPYVLDRTGLSLSEVKDCWPAVVDDVNHIERFMWS